MYYIFYYIILYYNITVGGAVCESLGHGDMQKCVTGHRLGGFYHFQHSLSWFPAAIQDVSPQLASTFSMPASS